MKDISLSELCEKLHSIFDSEDVCIEEVREVVEAYNPKKFNDWKDKVLFDDHKYTRNLVDGGNGKFNLILLGWSEDQYSPVHDHAGSHCFMKVVDGTIEEALYEWPDKQDSMKLVRKTVYEKGVAYIHDKIGLHRVGNPSLMEPSVTLHLYSPPILTCSRFDERTGTSFNCGNVTFYSNNGVKCQPSLPAASLQ